MIELIYTSAKIGLRPGSSGFTSVAWTRGIPTNLIDPLESMSSYKHVFLPGDPQCGKNPVCFSYQQVQYGSINFPCFSRISDAGLDYTSRSNKIAHHIVPENTEELESFCADWGPTGLFLSDANFEKKWNDVPHMLPQRKAVFPFPPKSIRASFWEKWMGDAGWAGVFAQKVLNIAFSKSSDYSDSLYLVYNLNLPPDDLIRMIAEITVLLPADQRASCTFNTYFVQQQLGVSCLLRAVLEDSSIFHTMQRLKPHNVFRICEKTPIPSAFETNPYVRAARTGIPVPSVMTLEPESIYLGTEQIASSEGMIQKPGSDLSGTKNNGDTLFMIPQEEIKLQMTNAGDPHIKNLVVTTSDNNRSSGRKMIFFLIVSLFIFAVLALLVLIFSLESDPVRVNQPVTEKNAPQFSDEERVADHARRQETTPAEEKKHKATGSREEKTINEVSADANKKTQKKRLAPEKKTAQKTVAEQRKKQESVLPLADQKAVYKACLEAVCMGRRKTILVNGKIKNVSVKPADITREGIFATERNGIIVFEPSPAEKKRRLDSFMQIRELVFDADTEILHCPMHLGIILDDLQPIVKVRPGTGKFEISVTLSQFVVEFPDVKAYLSPLPEKTMLNSLSDVICDWNKTLAERKNACEKQNRCEIEIKKYFTKQNKNWDRKAIHQFDDSLEKIKTDLENINAKKEEAHLMIKKRRTLFRELDRVLQSGFSQYAVTVGVDEMNQEWSKIEKLWKEFENVCKDNEDLSARWKNGEEYRRSASDAQKDLHGSNETFEKAAGNEKKCNDKLKDLKKKILEEAKILSISDIFREYVTNEKKIPMTGDEGLAICKNLEAKIVPRFKYAVKKGE